MTSTLICACDVSPLRSPECYAAAYAELSDERKQKTDAFRFEKDKLLSVGAGRLLQKTLTDFGVAPEKQQFTRDKNGKPVLTAQNGVFFNLSHAGTYVLCAAANAPVGCDIEDIRTAKTALAQKIFSPAEYADILAGKTDEERAERFFRLWTLRESYMKFTGLGLGLSLSRFEIRRKAGEVLLDGIKQPVFLREYGDIPGYAAAVCTGNDILPEHIVLQTTEIY